LLAARAAVDFVEVVAESCFAREDARREARAIAEVWPVVPHGVKLGLGGAEGIDDDRARRLGDLARELAAPCITEHVAFVRAGGREIGHLTALPHTHEAADVVARNVARARRRLPDVPLYLENVAWSLRWPDDAMREGDFYHEVCARSGCDLLLDVGNLYANALNTGELPLDLLASYPLERVRMVHIAGGMHEDGFYFDTHAHKAPDEVFELLSALVERAGPVPVVLERDIQFPSFAELAAEVARARTMVGPEGCQERYPLKSNANAPLPDCRPSGSMISDTHLAATQSHLAALLTSDAPPTDTSPFDPAAIDRSRSVLDRKRVDDALPLLPRLSAASPDVAALALACVRATPRAHRHGAATDAIRIADRATRECGGRAAEEARADRLVLSAQYSIGRRGELRPRTAPYVARYTTSDNVLWVFKGPGKNAPVRILSR
jgi:uncharacterized protein (UPF0276 family)